MEVTLPVGVADDVVALDDDGVADAPTDIDGVIVADDEGVKRWAPTAVRSPTA